MPNVFSPNVFSESRTEETLHSTRVAAANEQAAAVLVWGHGWGHSGESFRDLADALAPFAASVLLDFPGFGRSQPPPTAWGSADYADAVARWADGNGLTRFAWIGHSFGGRVGIQLAVRHPHLLSGLVLIASAGLPRLRTWPGQLRFAIRRRLAQAASLLTPPPLRERLRTRIGSRDYRAAGAMRPILTRVVAEDLSSIAAQVRCPTLLIYGDRDTETPSDIGERLHPLIPGSELVILSGYGHLDILTEGRHQLVLRIHRFLQTLP